MLMPFWFTPAPMVKVGLADPNASISTDCAATAVWDGMKLARKILVFTELKKVIWPGALRVIDPVTAFSPSPRKNAEAGSVVDGCALQGCPRQCCPRHLPLAEVRLPLRVFSVTAPGVWMPTPPVRLLI